MHMAHTMLYRLAKPPPSTNLVGIIRDLKSFTKREPNRSMVEKAKQFHYAEKWISNDQIYHKLSISSRKTHQTTGTQITQILKFRSTQYMGNHRKNLLWPQMFTNPNYTLCQNNDKDTWPHLLSLCNHKFLKGLKIARHNATTNKSSTYLNHVYTQDITHLQMSAIKEASPRTTPSHHGSYTAHAKPQNAHA